MKRKIFSLCFLGIILITLFLNFNSFIFGNPKWYNTVASVLYIALWYIFIILSKGSKPSLNFAVIWAFLTLVCSIIIFIVNLYDGKLIVNFIIPFALIFITPMSGIVTFFRYSKFFMASIVYIIVSISWIITSVIYLKKLRSHAK